MRSFSPRLGTTRPRARRYWFSEGSSGNYEASAALLVNSSGNPQGSSTLLDDPSAPSDDSSTRPQGLLWDAQGSSGDADGAIRLLEGSIIAHGAVKRGLGETQGPSGGLSAPLRRTPVISSSFLWGLLLRVEHPRDILPNTLSTIV
jgi:hypothetical protein